MDKNDVEWQKEFAHLQYCETIIQSNIDRLSNEVNQMKEDTKELYDNYRSNNPELHNDLVIGLDLQNLMEKSLHKNQLAKLKPYFGRIDYIEQDAKDKTPLTLYIGKNGIMLDNVQVLIVDWRAPVSSVYYDSDIGESSYPAPLGEQITIDLKIKRTFDLDGGTLLDFYDTDIIANDEFLTKYLSKNKEVILGEIIATIQKKQNEIIRDTPWHNVVVQGVAGSGKTTVAMHRISYILYNYKEKFQQDEFYIIGSNKMLLNYITGVLPNLDVYNINQLTLEEFALSLLGKNFNAKRFNSKANHITNENAGNSAIKRWKGSIHSVKALELFMNQYEEKIAPKQSLVYHGKLLYSRAEILQTLSTFHNRSLQERIDMLNKHLINKVKNINEMLRKDKDEIRSEVNKYRYFFGKKNKKIDLSTLYYEFLLDLHQRRDHYLAQGTEPPQEDDLLFLLNQWDDKYVSIYELCMLLYIKKRLVWCEDFSYVKHIVVDEAQDFGVSIFYILKKLFPECTYTIMGDVSQNIYYDTGMNDWETLNTVVFQPNKDRFYVLSKSYRNTLEISNYASAILKKCTFHTYAVEPIIRHGKQVEVTRVDTLETMVTRSAHSIQEMLLDGYDTIAVICHSEDEAALVQSLLSKEIHTLPITGLMEDMSFHTGVMVLPIYMTKGLEFDAVILWNPSVDHYPFGDEAAKLLYVATTRALHELRVIHKDPLSKLLINN